MYLSRRLWILVALFVALCALALVQYSWVNQLAQAERQHAKASLAGALADVESDFDVEITRAFMIFQIPSDSRADYARRYREWLRHAPYPRLIRGVYLENARQPDLPPKAVLPGEPAISIPEWKRVRPKPILPFAGFSTSAGAFGSAMSFRTVTRGGMTLSVDSFHPEMRIDGNPTFFLPILPTPRAHVVISRRPGPVERFSRGRIVGFVGPSCCLLVVLDADYIRTTFLPKLVGHYLPSSVYEVQVLSRNSGIPYRLIYASEPANSNARFVRPDGRIALFQLRPDCFSPPNNVKADGSAMDVSVFSPNSMAEILARGPTTCGIPAGARGVESDGLWEMLVRYGAGSLDEAITAFRDRNLLMGGSVLLVLAVGISMLVILTERARALAEMQAEFALGVSHELRTPLTVIRLAADNLKKGIVENSEQARKYGDIIHAHATELSSMIEETLAFARMHSPTLLRQQTLACPEQVVMAAVADSERALHDAGIELEMDLPPDLPHVTADADLLKRCFKNLIQNAVKYAVTGRWMAIRARKASRPEGERVEISFEDRGGGISPTDLPHIFEPFYRGKHGDATRVPGVGLGLTLVKRVVEAHHGSVEVETGKRGTRFLIFLPAHRAQLESRTE